MSNDLVQKIEAILFYLAEPVSLNYLTKTLEVSKKDVESAIKELETNLQSRGLRIISHDGEIVLSTAPELSKTIEKIIKEERERDLGRAGIETLSIIAYKGPVSKKEIEYIRGVNSQYALRSLLLRGLVEKKESRTDERMVLYTITGDTLRYLGLQNIEDLPEYEQTSKNLEIPQDEVSERGEIVE
jgi:segregation and condensation protein B